MLADRIFGAAGAARSAPAQEAGRAPKRKPRARPRARPMSPEVMQRRLDLAGLALIGAGGLPGLRRSISAGTGARSGDGSADGALLRGRRRRDRGAGRPRRAGTGLILRPFLPSPAIRGGRRGGDRSAGCCSRSPRRPPASARTACARASSIPTSSRTTAAASARPSTGPRPRSSSGSARTSWRCVLIVSGVLLLSRPLGLGHAPRRSRGGADRARRGTVGFATAVKETGVSTDPDLIETAPADDRAALRAAGAGRRAGTTTEVSGRGAR